LNIHDFRWDAPPAVTATRVGWNYTDFYAIVCTMQTNSVFQNNIIDIIENQYKIAGDLKMNMERRQR